MPCDRFEKGGENSARDGCSSMRTYCGPITSSRLIKLETLNQGLMVGKRDQIPKSLVKLFQLCTQKKISVGIQFFFVLNKKKRSFWRDKGRQNWHLKDRVQKYLVRKKGTFRIHRCNILGSDCFNIVLWKNNLPLSRLFIIGLVI